MFAIDFNFFFCGYRFLLDHL